MRVFSSEPLQSLKNRLKLSFISETLDDSDYSADWVGEEDRTLSEQPPGKRDNTK